jgi:hypothetical protein
MTDEQRLVRVRFWLALFVAGLVVAGITAFPLEWETKVASLWLHGQGAWLGSHLPGLRAWIDRAHRGFADSYARYPFLAYGTDWLAFGHLTIAAAFIGPFRDPVRNKWVVQWGMAACLLVIPLAAIAGPLRGIPLLWMPVDMSFGVVGIVPLILAYGHLRALERHASQLQPTLRSPHPREPDRA